MGIQIIVVGKLKSGFAYLQPGIEDYLKRLKAYTGVSIVEVQDEPIAVSKTDEQIMEKEAQRLYPYIERADFSIALSEHGELLSSENFARRFLEGMDGNPSNGGRAVHESGNIIVIVGGPLGLSQRLLEKCDWVLSLSKMTFPHPMVRLILLEQLYRAFKIQRNEPYHK